MHFMNEATQRRGIITFGRLTIPFKTNEKLKSEFVYDLTLVLWLDAPDLNAELALYRNLRINIAVIWETYTI